MEFSFDRSKDARRERPETPSASSSFQNQTQSQAQTVGATRPGPDLNTVDPSTIANERLRKAIERNRAKQAGREAMKPAETQASQPQATQSTEPHRQESFFSNTQTQAQPQPQTQPAGEYYEQAPRTEVQPEMHAQHSRPEEVEPRARVRERVGGAASAPVSRRSVAKPEDTEFVPVKRTTRKVASQISYTTSSSTSRKKTKPVDPKYVAWLVKGCWIFCGLMVLRLIFASGGVTDFYSQKGTVNERLAELSSIKKENMQLVREIERMRSDIGFQKKLVRDNLGFIAADEFLVLFPKEK